MSASSNTFTLGTSSVVVPGTATSASAPLGLRRGVERPKPLRIGAATPSMTATSTTAAAMSTTATATAKLSDLECLVTQLSQLTPDRIDPHVAGQVNALLKTWGKEIEDQHKDRMDRIQATIHAACCESRIDKVSKLNLLEVIELRAMHWVPNDKVENYYKQKLAESVSPPPSSVPPTPTTAGNACAKEDCGQDNLIGVRSSNQGISPQPTFKGDHKFEVAVGEEKIYIYGSNANLVRIAKIVLDDHFGEHKLHSKKSGSDLPSSGHSSAPIQTNPFQERRVSTSSRPCRNPLFPGALPEEVQRVEFNAITGADLAAKERRQNFSKTQQESQTMSRLDTNNNNDGNNVVLRDVFRYDRDFLLQCAKSPESLKTPKNWDQIVAEFPVLSRKVCEGEDQVELSKSSSSHSPNHRQEIKPWKTMRDDVTNTRA